MSLDPFILFKKWFEEAEKKEINDPNAMNLCTLSKSLKPSSRIVLLKDFDKKGFIFYTNIKSKKGISILQNPNVSLNFHWKSLLRQVRIEGRATKVADKKADQYYYLRPKESKIGAWASSQSKTLKNREILNKKIQFYKKKFLNKKISRPFYWTGFIVDPKLIEFWQDMPHRLHDRLEYKKINNKWIARKLYP